MSHKNKITTAELSVSQISDGSVIMIGGFLGCGVPEIIIDALVKKGSKNLTIISNDATTPELGVGKLLRNGQIKNLLVSHAGTNPEVAKKMKEEKETFKCEFIPQGTLAERIRAGGNGLGGILTKTGVGTLVAQGKQTIKIDGQDFLLELPLKADFALVCGWTADKMGNTIYKGTARNFNPLMAAAADKTIMSVNKIVEIGDIDPNNIITPGIFINYLVLQK
ncbi:MAG: CoA transferase subunit A [Elusimicrobiota bacterium]|jgi:acetate CoA/acetoacetate CoA-transferase alpha subunit|nr:CoA transferase subunit A [Elusimicrobiota bacterium]